MDTAGFFLAIVRKIFVVTEIGPALLALPIRDEPELVRERHKAAVEQERAHIRAEQNFGVLIRQLRYMLRIGELRA